MYPEYIQIEIQKKPEVNWFSVRAIHLSGFRPYDYFSNIVERSLPRMKPRALLCLRSDKTANICAWCPDKKAADELALAGGYQLNHTICDDCAAKLKKELPGVPVSKTVDEGRPATEAEIQSLRDWVNSH